MIGYHVKCYIFNKHFSGQPKQGWEHSSDHLLYRLTNLANDNHPKVVSLRPTIDDVEIDPRNMPFTWKQELRPAYTDQGLEADLSFVF